MSKVLMQSEVMPWGAMYPGEPVSDDQVANVTSTGATLADTSDPNIAAASVICESLRGAGKADIGQLATIMQLAVNKSMAAGVTPANIVAAKQSSWCIDPKNGDDIVGDGSMAKPLKTAARMEALIGEALLSQPTVVSLMGSAAPGDVITRPGIGAGGYLSYDASDGGPVVATGTVTTAQAARPSFVITAATATTPIVCTFSSPAYAPQTGDVVVIPAGSYGLTGLAGQWKVTRLSSTTFSLTGSVGSGSYTASSATATWPNVAASITDAGIASYTAYVGKMLRRVSDGAVTWIGATHPAGTAIVGDLQTMTPAPFPDYGSNRTAWAAGDVYQIIDPAVWPVADAYRPIVAEAVSGVYAKLDYRFMRFGAGVGGSSPGTQWGAFPTVGLDNVINCFACCLSGQSAGIVTTWACQWDELYTPDTGASQSHFGAVFLQTIITYPGSDIDLNDGCLLLGASPVLQVGGAVTLFGDGAGVILASGDAVRVGDGGVLMAGYTAYGSVGALWGGPIAGYGNATYAVRVDPAGTFVWFGQRPTIAAQTGDIIVDDGSVSPPVYAWALMDTRGVFAPRAFARHGTFVLNGSTGVIVTVAGMLATDFVTVTCQTAGGTRGLVPTVVCSNGSFLVTGPALDLSTYAYRVSR